MLRLVMGPDHPDRLLFDPDGIAYARDFAVREKSIPRRFSGPARPGDSAGPPFTTVVFGLEMGRFDMRERFLRALRRDAGDGRPLTRYGDALESAFRETFGGRGSTADTPGFLAWLRGAIDQASNSDERAQLTRGLRDTEARPEDARIAELGARSVSFGSETGHLPADHPELLYWLSSLVPDWEGAHFQQTVPKAIDERDEDGTASYVLQAWYAGQELRAPARNCGDYLDVMSCAGFANRILRDVLRRDVRVWSHEQDDVGRLVAATLPVLRKLRAEGVISQDEEYADD
jgi:hypothetical protein